MYNKHWTLSGDSRARRRSTCTPAIGTAQLRNKPAANRRYHNNNICSSGRNIPPNERRSGQGGYRLCEHCKRLS
jgi:hypothetical protein